ncbi:MAG TPA: hypothetical protein VHF22_03070 [Planctomycetota bacterium]|nr:hypothetical protein [Planctomycetota bacterium]
MGERETQDARGREAQEDPVFEMDGDGEEGYSSRPGGADAGLELEQIEEVLRELADGEQGGIPLDLPLAEAGAGDAREEARAFGGEPEDGAKADGERATASEGRPWNEEMFPPAACAEDETPDGAPVFQNPIDYADVVVESGTGVAPRPQPELAPAAEVEPEPEAAVYEPTYEVAIAEPMTAHDASIVALGDNVRQVTHLIESVGRTLEAQNQRSLRLMERLEAVAKALECLPEEADRGLEGLDAVGEAIKEGTAPLREINERLGDLPDVVRAVRESSDSTRELWSVATRAMAGRLAFSAVEERQRERREASRRRWRILASSALAVAAFALGSLFTGSDVGDRARVALGTAILGDHAASADEGGAHWRVIGVRPLPPPEGVPTATAQPAGGK